MKPIQFLYKNHEGKVSLRTVIPREINFSINPNISEPTWLLWGHDLDKNQERSYVLSHILKWNCSEVSQENEFQRHFCVTVYVKNETSDRFVFIKHKKLNKWLPPGGHVEKDETPDDAARREVREEAGLEIELLGEKFCGPLVRPEGMQLNVIKKDQHEHIDCIYAATAKTENLKLNSLESDDCRWFSKEEILDKDFDTFPEVKKWVERFSYAL